MPYPAALTCNDGVCRCHGRYEIVFLNDYGRWGDTSFHGANLGLAFSKDGVSWEVQRKPCTSVDEARGMLFRWYHNRLGGIGERASDHEVIRFYGPQLTVIEDRVLICEVDATHGLRARIASTADFSDWPIRDLSISDNRNAVLFPDRIDDRYLKLDTLFNKYGGDDMSAGSCAPRLDTSRAKRGWEDRWPKVFHSDVSLFERDDSKQALSIADEPLLSPQAAYETGEGLDEEDVGFHCDMVFPSGVVLDGDRLRVYSRAADTVECLAKADVHEVLCRLL